MKNKKTQEKEKKGLFFVKKDISLGITDFTTLIKYSFSKTKQITDENSIFEEIYRFEEGEEKKHSRYTKREKWVFMGLTTTILNIFLLVFCYVNSYVNLHGTILSNNIIYILTLVIIPFHSWIQGTDENFWAFHQRKRLFFYLCCINALMVLFQPLYTLIRNLVLRLILKIPINLVLTTRMLLLLCHVLLLLLISTIGIIIYSQLEPLISSKSLKKQIELFKYSHVKDKRENREYKYDITTIKDLETGKPIIIKEKDRMNQTELNGPSGTGKTSSVFIPTIEKDLDQKIKNREKRHEEILKLIKDKKATIQGPLREFDENAIIPLGKTKGEYERNKKALTKIKKDYPDCGMTIIAPNAALIMDIIKLSKARGTKVNILDPMNDYTLFDNAIVKGINPFYIPFDITEEEKVIYISQAATVFAEVLIATNQMNGAAPETYFTDIALSVSSNIATVVMLAKNIKREQAIIDDIQNCISDFQNLRPYIEIIEEHYNIKINTPSIKTNMGTNADDIKRNKASIDAAAKSLSKRNDIRKNPYYMQLLFVAQELLGGGSEEMFSQARGLRNLINKVLQDTRIKSILSASDNHLDFDKLLYNNEITVVNTAIELGKSASTAFGLFFILLHKVSVLRRPVDTRTPHFLWVDEASQYMHPCYEDMISLYRQYCCAVVVALQSLTQTEKSSATAYLKNVFLGAGSHIVFGRLSAEEMKIYSEMSGIVREDMEQVSHTSNSIFSTNPNSSDAVRLSPTMNKILEGSDLRLLDFQELTVFTTDNGRVLPGRLARVFFVKEEAFDKRRTRTILWEKVVPEAFKIQEDTEKPENINTNNNEIKNVSPVEKENTVKSSDLFTKIPSSETKEVLTQVSKPIALVEDKKEEFLDLENMSANEIFKLLYLSSAETKEDYNSQNPIKSDKITDTEEIYSDISIDYEKQLELLKNM